MALGDRILDHPLDGVAHPITPLVGYRHSMARTLLRYRRLGAYTGAGLASGAVNLVLFHVAVRAHVAPHLAWVLAFEIGALFAFLLHRHITWRDRRVRTVLELLRQLASAQAGALLALVLNFTIFTILVRFGMPDDLDDALGLAAGFVLNYALAHHFIFGPHRVHARQR